MNRNELPAWVNAAIDRIADSPMSLLGRLAARRLGRPAPFGTISSTIFDEKPFRVLIAPVNYSGQGTAWARSLERVDPEISARNMALEVPGGFSFQADLLVPVGTYHNDRDWQRRQLAAASQATHVLVEAEEPPFGRLFGRSVSAQVTALLERGVNVAYLAHGTDVRLPSRHIAANPLSYYDDPAVYRPRAEQLAARNIALVEGSCRPTFVSTPDLLLDLPQARWCPVAVDIERWAAPTRAPRADGALLRVVHAPSVAATKGTSLILPVLQKLADAGILEFSLAQGIPSAEMPKIFAEADVLLDQFRIGSYGVAACEAMAAGCIVIGQVSEQVRDHVATETNLELPIIEATPDTLEFALRELAARPDLRLASEQSVSFVREVHDGRLAARVLRDSWIRPAAPRKELEDAPRD